RAVSEIADVVGNVVDLPESLFVVGRKVLRCELNVFFGLGKARSGVDCTELVAVMGTDVPGSRAAHGKTSENNAVRIDEIVGFYRLDRLENIDFPGVFPSHAMATEGMEDDGFVLVFDQAAESLAPSEATLEK